MWYTICVLSKRKPQKTPMRGAQRQRLRFMESVAYWEGFVRRQRLSDTFNLNIEGLSRDFTLYRSLYPGNLNYDTSRKGYEPTAQFKPQIASGSAEEYLGLLRLHCEATAPELVQGLPGPMVAAHVPLQAGGVSANTLKDVTRAIVAGSGLTGMYQSMRVPEPEPVELWPAALVFSGYRWHVRAYDASKGMHRDCVLARLSVKPTSNEPPEIPPDQAWERNITVIARPSSRWSDPQKNAIAAEYAMQKHRGKWQWKVSLRECLVPYFLYLHRLDRPISQQRIELVDPDFAKRHGFADE